MLYSYVEEVFPAVLDVFLRVEILDAGKSHDDVVCNALRHQPFQIFLDLQIALSGVPLVDVVVGIFQIYKIMVDDGQELLHILFRHIEGRLQGEVPFWAAQFTELRDEVGMQGWFSSAEGDSAAGCQEVELVNHNAIVQLLWRKFDGMAVGTVALRIEAISAAQRATVECRQGGHSFAVCL